MRVLHVIAAARQGGAEQLLWLIGRELHRRGIHVTVLFFDDGPLRPRFEDAGLTCDVLPGVGRFRPTTFASIRATLRALDPSVVHVHGLRALFHVAPIARRQRYPVVYSAHSVSSVKDVEYGALGPAYRMFEGLLCRWFISAVVVTSSRMRDDLVARSAVPRSLVRVIPPCIDLERLPCVTAQSREEARRRFNVSGHVVAMIGRLIPPKGHAVMVRALMDLPASTLVIAGDGPERERLSGVAAALGVESRVRFLGETGDVAAVCHASDVVVYPSTEGIIGLAALEAMACGVPVIAADQPGATEFIESGTTGILVTPRDSEGLAREVAALVADPARASVLANAGSLAARARYSPSAAAALHLSLYEALTAGSTRQAPSAPAPSGSDT